MAQARKVALESTEWLDYRVYFANLDDLPRVLLIGDSISGQYFEGLAKGLAGKAYVSRLGSSKGISVPAYFDEVGLALSQHRYNVIHFNNGLHGWDYSEEDYGRDLNRLVEFLQALAPEAKLIWAASTQMRVGKPDFLEFDPLNARVQARNEIAGVLMVARRIPTNDLYSLTEPHTELLSDGIHYTSEGAALLVSRVVEVVVRALDAS